MDWRRYVGDSTEQPLDRYPTGISETAIFRTMAFIGDSLSSGEIQSRDAEGKSHYHDYYEYSWGQYLARKNGFEKAFNFSCGGLSSQRFLESYVQKHDVWNSEKICQAYVIALGVNDLFYFKQDVGTVGDMDIEDSQTIAHYYGNIIRRVKDVQPRAKIFLVTIPRHGNEQDERRGELAELVRAFAEYFDNTYVIDLFRYAPVFDADFIKQFFLYGHMTASGYIFMANMIDAYIDYLVRHNPEDFRRVPFIGTDLE